MCDKMMNEDTDEYQFLNKEVVVITSGPPNLYRVRFFIFPKLINGIQNLKKIYQI